MSTSARARAAITATARHFPEAVVENRYFYETLGLDTSEEWIRSRTGIRTRHRADHKKGEITSTLGAEAARKALKSRGIGADDVDCIILATVTPDLGFPSTACLVQDQISAHRAWAFDVSAACSGFVYALAQATSLVESGRHQRVLVIGADVMSAILDQEDRNTCVLFGDGAGAVLVEAVPEDHPGALGQWRLRSDGSGAEHLFRYGGGILERVREEPPEPKGWYVHQDGRTVFKLAVTRLAEVVQELLAAEGLTVGDIDLTVPHQANIRIIEAARDKLRLPPEKVMVTIGQWANTTAATIPTSLDLAVEQHRLRAGDRVMLATFGGGFTWGAMLLRWGYDT